MHALVLIDLQNDFFPGGSLAVPRSDEVLPVANRLLEAFGLVVATQDWHPADHMSFALNHPGKKPGDVLERGKVPQVLWPAHCVQGTPGAELVTALRTDRITRTFRKGTDPAIDSYSGFFDNDHRRGTGLYEYLKGARVTGVYIMGLAADYCVKFTALDSVSLGFKTFVIEDGCRAVNLEPNGEKNAIEEMVIAGVSIIRSDQRA